MREEKFLNMPDIEKKFRKPYPEYRSAPFWSWNDDLKDKYLYHQLDEMKKGGMAGGFMHSRTGLITPYLSKNWMNRIRNTVSHAKDIGIPIYLYDEDRWPSGFAGGIVTKNRRYAMKAIRITMSQNNKCRFEPITIPSHEWFNNCGYLDTLSHEAVREFIKSTYTAYKRAVGDEFNKTIPSIFTDEPNCLTVWQLQDKGSLYLPWTDGLDKIFERRYGYDLRKNFICFVKNKGDYKKVRYQFIKLITELFVENFGKQIHTWCEENNIALTGHYLEEDTLASQIRVLGAAMPFYEYMHIPGVDHLGRQVQGVNHLGIRIPSAYLTIKQCSSVAHQLGKERVLSELFGCSGYNMTFTDRKWIGNWNTVLGINLFCPHLWLYSMAGSRKRDHPPAISYQQPYWKYNKVIEDYFARINFITNQGKFYSNILVLHPVESGWCLYNPADVKPVDRLNNKFVSILKTLSGKHFDYDLGDESLISRYGKVIKRTGAMFRVGRMDYPLVIVPPVISLRKTTIELLNEFLGRGGKVIGFKPFPERVDGEKDENGLIKEIYPWIYLLPESGSHLISSIETLLKRDISITDVNKGSEIEDIYYQHRVADDNTDIYFLVNNNKEKDWVANIRIPKEKNASLEIWNPVTGDISALKKVNREDGYLNTSLYFPEAGSYILLRREKGVYRQYYQNPTMVPHGHGKEIIRLSESDWVCKQKGLNSIAIDYCQYKTCGMKRWSKPAYVLDVQDILKRRLKNNSPFSIKYAFKAELNKMPEKVFLVIERPEQYEINVNGKKIRYRHTGYWIDITFKKIEITGYIITKGENIIELRSKFIHPTKPKTLIYVKGGSEIESIYIVGNFNVDARFKPVRDGMIGQDFKIIDEKEPLISDTVTSGYPFYAGEFVFSQDFDLSFNMPKVKMVFLSIDKPDAITLKVTINKKDAGLIVWPPYRLNVTDLLKKGKNHIEIELTNSLRNLLGPHHQRMVNPEGVCPGSFNDKKNWIDSYTFMPFGIGKLIIFYLD